MKKITLLFLFLAISFTGYAQFPEGFETAVPPTGWASFIGTNGEGTTQDWTTTTTTASGTQAAKVRYENVANAAEDWLVTPQFTPTPNANILTFKQRQDFGTDYGTTYTIRVSTSSQMTHADFTIIDTQGETDFGTSYTTHNVNLSAYDNVPIYVAFVMEQDDGDSWFIDDVDVVLDASAPNCATDPTPADMATDVAVSAAGNVTIAWVAPAAGDPATDYEIFWGETSGSLTSLGTISALTVDITNIDFSTTYYWMVVPQNNGGSATGCTEWSFTTEAAPPAPANDLPAGAIALTVEADLSCVSGITGITNQSTTDSGVTAPSCGSYGTPTERGDLWYTAVAPTGGAITFDVSNITVMTSVAGAFYSGTVGSLVEESCTEFGSGWPWAISGLTPGETYYVRVWDYGNDQTGTFDLCAGTPPPPPANDNCADASGINTLPFNSVGDATSATNTGGFLAPSGCGSMNDGVWYTFTTDAAGTIDIALTGVTGWDPEIAIYSGSCGTFTCVDNADSNGSGSGESLTNISVDASTQYWINIGYFSGTADSSEGSYTLDVSTSDTTTVLSTDDNTLQGFSLFPTVVKEELKFTSQNTVDQITIFSLLGQKVFSSSPNSANSQVNLASLRAGIYIVKVKVGDKTGTYKIIKE